MSFDSSLFPPTDPVPLEPAVAQVCAPTRLSTFRWLVEGLRASVLLTPHRALHAHPGPWQTLFLIALASLIEVGTDRITYSDADLQFHFQGWFTPWGVSLVLLWCAWCALPRGEDGERNASRLGSWFVVQTWALIPVLVAGCAWLALGVDDVAEDRLKWSDVLIMALLCLWTLLVMLRLSRLYFESWTRAVVFILAAGSIAVVLFAVLDVNMWVAAEDAVVQPAQSGVEDEGVEQNEDGDDRFPGEGDEDEIEEDQDAKPEYLEAHLAPAPNAGQSLTSQSIHSSRPLA